MSTQTVDTSFELDFKDNTYEVSVELTFDISSSGIGSFEHWGHKDYDAGHLTAEFTGYTVIEVTDEGKEIEADPDLLGAIDAYIDSMDMEQQKVNALDQSGE